VLYLIIVDLYLIRENPGGHLFHLINLLIDFKPHQPPQAAGHLLFGIWQFQAYPEGVADGIDHFIIYRL
jgi:hypothetical protein